MLPTRDRYRMRQGAYRLIYSIENRRLIGELKVDCEPDDEIHLLVRSSQCAVAREDLATVGPGS